MKCKWQNAKAAIAVRGKAVLPQYPRHFQDLSGNTVTNAGVITVVSMVVILGVS
jgi:hypothetical protein